MDGPRRKEGCFGRREYFRKDLGRVASLDDGDVDEADYADNAVKFNAVVLETRSCISDRAVHIDLKFLPFLRFECGSSRRDRYDT